MFLCQTGELPHLKSIRNHIDPRPVEPLNIGVI